MMEKILSVKNLKKHYKTKHGIVKAVNDISFEMETGKTCALVGESGCGKSTVALAILRLIEFNGGCVFFEDTDLGTASRNQIKRIRRNMSVVFQDPYSSLNPKMKICNIVGEPLKDNYDLRGPQLRSRVAMSLSDVGLGPEHINRYPHEFSGGQRQRIAIARALAVDPKLIILDEPTAALDVSVQAQVLNLLRKLQEKLGLSYLFISHNLSTVESIADHVMVMYLGKIVESGPVEGVFANPRHPYTKALLDSVPSIDPLDRNSIKPLHGEIPSPLNLPIGCSFVPRCSRAENRCRSAYPSLQKENGDRAVACYCPLERTFTS